MKDVKDMGDKLGQIYRTQNGTSMLATGRSTGLFFLVTAEGNKSY